MTGFRNYSVRFVLVGQTFHYGVAVIGKTRGGLLFDLLQRFLGFSTTNWAVTIEHFIC